jgi:hypothetical protein
VEGGALRRNAKICTQGEGHASSDGHPVNRRNYRFIAMKTKGHEELTYPVRVV